MRRAFSEEDFPVNFSQRKNDFEIESTPGKKNTSVNLTSYEIKTGIECFFVILRKKKFMLALFRSYLPNQLAGQGHKY